MIRRLITRLMRWHYQRLLHRIDQQYLDTSMPTITYRTIRHSIERKLQKL